ncbi:hypothetical protein TAMA11512_20210 [Selenomonas sp. TAMA-11512]|nr:hypothetical protein TAMA11512_20210 [Selenomonas sp. TAMA-11512]
MFDTSYSITKTNSRQEEYISRSLSQSSANNGFAQETMDFYISSCIFARFRIGLEGDSHLMAKVNNCYVGFIVESYIECESP